MALQWSSKRVMSPKFSIKSGLLTLSLSAAAAFAVLTPAPAAHAGDDGPSMTTCDSLKKASVKSHCGKVKGKTADIRKAMKKAEKDYKAAGKGDIKCGSCHVKGTKGGELKAESEELWPAFEPFFKAAGGV